MTARAERTTLAQIREATAKAVEEWAAKCDVDEVRKRTFELLDRSLHEVIAKLLGMSDRWHDTEWEVDHCNGRSGQSFIGKAIKAHAEAAAEAWVIKALATDPAPGAQIEKAILREYKDAFRYRARERVLDLAETHARKCAEEAVAKATRELGAEDDDAEEDP